MYSSLNTYILYNMYNRDDYICVCVCGSVCVYLYLYMYHYYLFYSLLPGCYSSVSADVSLNVFFSLFVGSCSFSSFVIVVLVVVVFVVSAY